MVIRLSNNIRPTMSEKSGCSVMLDTGAIISVFNADEELFTTYYPNASNTGLVKDLGGFGGSAGLCPVYEIPELMFEDLRIINLPVVVCVNKSIPVDMVLAGHVFCNHPFKLDYKNKSIEVESNKEIRCRYTISKNNKNMIHSFIAF